MAGIFSLRKILRRKKKKRAETESEKEASFLRKRGTTTFLDVGANTGQTGLGLREAGWEGRIVSFEPLADCFEKLKLETEKHRDWQAFNYAVGDQDGQADIGVSQNRVSSSLRNASDLLVSIFDPIRYEASAKVSLIRLSTIFDQVVAKDDIVHLKIDTQGYERNVIQGAIGVLERIDSVRMEVAVSEFYEGEMLVPEAITMMTELGFVLVDAWTGWRHPRTKEVLYFDLLFRIGKTTV